MSIKSLFEQNKRYTVPTPEKDIQDIFIEAESVGNVAEKLKFDNYFVPTIDFSNPKEFVKFGSAESYYSSSIDRILNEYPYDGSRKELNEYLNSSTYLDLYILEKKYPKTTGFINFSAYNSTYTGGKIGGYGNPSNKEYITILGGPNTASVGMEGKPLAKTFDDSNKAQINPYTSEGVPESGRSGTRTSNLLFDLSKGITLEFWLNKQTFNTSSTEKEIIFDLWNSEVSSSSGYGRLLVGLTGSSDGSSLLFFEASSGSVTTFSTASLVGYTTSSLIDGSWKHYAISFENSGSNLLVKTYVNGGRDNKLTYSNASLGKVSGSLKANIGALQTSPSGSAYASYNMTGYAKLSGSLDEFRFWKSSRNEKEINRYYNINLGGGTNTDISNTELGIYYKFNEGITGTSSIDSIVLDYSGRISNGTWVGYPGMLARSTGSAIVLGGGSDTEYLDPIVRADHPSVVQLKNELISSGSSYDQNNNSSIYYSLPSWIIDEDRSETNYESNLLRLTQIMSYQLDEIYLNTNNLNRLKNKEYLSSSYTKNYPFSDALIQNQGFVAPRIFDNAKLYEKILNFDNVNVFENSLSDIKNEIYNNIYNNLVHIYKTKGTNKSFRNLFRCYGIDDDIVNISIYPNNTRIKYEDKFQFSSYGKRLIDFNDPDRFASVVTHDYTLGSSSLTYISGNTLDNNLVYHGFTSEFQVIFPKKIKVNEPTYFNTTFLTSSVGGFVLPNTASTNTDFSFVNSSQEITAQVYAIRDELESKNVYFYVTGNVQNLGGFALTSSLFYDVYDNTKWDISLVLRPSKIPNIDRVSSTTDTGYTLEFRGINKVLDVTVNDFILTSSLSNQQGKILSSSPKRFYFGAFKTNLTGSTLYNSDLRIGSVKHWILPLEEDSLDSHSKNINNLGTYNSTRNTFENITSLGNKWIPELKTLALNWDYYSVTGSDINGRFRVNDYSGGSDTPNLGEYSYISDICARNYGGIGYNFPPSSTEVKITEFIGSSDSVLPDEIIDYDLVKVLDNDDEVFTKESLPVTYYFNFEKSPYRSISKEAINLFGSMKEFSKLYHQPVQRYRIEHKELDLVRQFFFDTVLDAPDIERYLSYYRWIDGSLSEMVRKLIPITADTSNRVNNVIESHILERNHYVYNYPLLSYKNKTVEGRVHGIVELLYPWDVGNRPLSNVEADNCYWWRRRAERDNPVITSGIAAVDSGRQNIRKVINLHTTGSIPNLSTSDGTAYVASDYSYNRFTQLYNFDMSLDTKFGNVVEKVLFMGLNAPNGFLTKVWKSIVNSLSGQTVVLDSFEEQEDCNDVKTIKLLQPVQVPPQLVKVRMRFRATFGTTQIGAYSILPFTFMSASAGVPNTGYQVQLTSSFGTLKRFDIIGHHSDVYDMDFEIPMQGPFTEKYVGGHSHRHVDINRYDAAKTGTNNLDNTDNRPEAYDLNISSDTITISSRNISKPRTTVARDGMAKKPLNIANIAHSTGSLNTVIGNYNLALDVVSTTGRSENDLSFNDTPFSASATGSLAINGTSEYTKLARTINKNVIVQRFSAPGDPATMGDNFGGPGLDAAHSEYSVYNALPFRNLSVRVPLRTFLSTRSEIAGLTSGSTPVAADYSGTGSFHGVYRNKLGKLGQTDTAYFSSSTSDNYFVQYQIPRNDLHYSWITGAAVTYNSFTVTTAGDVPSGFVAPDGKYSSSAGVNSAITFVTASSIVSYATSSNGRNVFGFVDGVTTGYSVIANSQLRTGFNGMTTNIVDPFDLDTMTLGLGPTASVSGYINPSLVSSSINTNNAYVLNSIIATRGGKLAKSSWSQVRHTDKKYIRKLKSTNTISHLVQNENEEIIFDQNTRVVRRDTEGTVYTFIEPVVSHGNRPIKLLLSRSNNKFVLSVTDSNENAKFANKQLNLLLEMPKRTFDTIDKIAEVIKSNPQSFLEISFEQTVYPSAINQTLSRIRGRTDFENNFWRDDRNNRNRKGSQLKYIISEEISNYAQSSWSLDTDEGFTTNAALSVGATEATGSGYRSGILQNNYSHVHSGQRDRMTIAPLYSRKHLLGAKHSFTPFSSVNNLFTQSLGNIGSMPSPSYSLGNGKIFAGNTFWEANTYAGIFGEGTQSNTFISKSINPFDDTYAIWNEQGKAINAEFSLIPEFRISNHIDFYLKEQNGNYLANNSNIFNIFGASRLTASNTVPSSSTDDNFYEIYSTTDLFDNLYDGLEKLDTNMSLITATTIKLKLKAIKKFVPYDGFYPAERTVELAKQFYDSYSPFIYARGNTGSLSATDDSIKIRPIYSTLFAPGVLYNTIKSGIAVDYPIYNVKTGRTTVQIVNANITGTMPNQNTSSIGSATEYYLLGTGSLGVNGFDYRVPFETLVDPVRYISNTFFVDMEPNQSAALDITASWDGKGDNLYQLMANNFLAEVPNFFLEDGEITNLVSEPQSTFKQFEPGKKYSMRIKIYRSHNAPRIFESDYPTPQNNYLQVAGLSGPRLNETLTMYSRPSAFGPPMAGREYVDTGSLTSAFRPDSLFAYDLAYTPPYYDGESWADIIFTPTSTSHTLDDIFGSASIRYWRIDSSSGWPAGTLYQTTPYGEYANNFAMQLSASVNLFGKQKIKSAEYDISGNPILLRDDKLSNDQVWIVQPKFETPILNFNEEISSGTMTIPLYGSESVARGMWHQFGKIPTDPNTGIFLELTDIDSDWMRNRAFTDTQLTGTYGSQASQVRSLLDVVQFRKKRAKLGKLASSRTVHEAIVAVPFLERDNQKKFFDLDPTIYSNARILSDNPTSPILANSPIPGKSVIEMVDKMKKYVLPPTFDFYTNPEINPFSMFIFEFSHTFTRNDLAYMWQNLAPIDSNTVEVNEEIILSDLLNTELLSSIAVSEASSATTADIKWIIFKVKQKALTNYYDKVLADSLKPDNSVKQVRSKIGSSNNSEIVDKYSYNWPYDYFSLIEFAKMDVEVIAKKKEDATGTSSLGGTPVDQQI